MAPQDHLTKSQPLLETATRRSKSDYTLTRAAQLPSGVDARERMRLSEDLEMVGGWHVTQTVSVSEMHEPENNAITCDTLERVVQFDPKLKTFICDRACKPEPAGRQRLEFKQMKTWCVDKFHAEKGHKKSCA